MATEDKYIYPSSNEKLPEDPATRMSQVPSEQDDVDYSVPPRKRETDQVVPDHRKEVDKKRRQRLSVWSYNCQVAVTQVNKQAKLTDAGKSLSPEEMQLLDEDIFNPLDIHWLISKNSKEATN